MLRLYETEEKSTTYIDGLVEPMKLEPTIINIVTATTHVTPNRMSTGRRKKKAINDWPLLSVTIITAVSMIIDNALLNVRASSETKC